MASIRLDFPAPFGLIIAVKSENGPIVWSPLYELKFSSSKRWILPGESKEGIVLGFYKCVEARIRVTQKLGVGIPVNKAEILREISVLGLWKVREENLGGNFTKAEW